LTLKTVAFFQSGLKASGGEEAMKSFDLFEG